MKKGALSIFLCALFALGSLHSKADPLEADPTCAPIEAQQNRYQYLRSLSLALKGAPPTLEELELLHSLPDVPENMIDEMLNSEEFARSVSRLHRKLLWNRIDNRSYQSAWGLNGSPAWGWHLSVVYRGKNIGCKNEPAEFNEDGSIVAEWNETHQAYQEGYVEVEPYWAPGTQVKVCAYNAQDNLVSPSGTPCGTKASTGDPGCGCGPNLQWCSMPESIDFYGTQTKIGRTIHLSISMAVEKTIEKVIMEDRPYTDIFLNNTTWMNGPIIHFWKYIAHRAPHLDRGETLLPLALNTATLPDVPFWDTENWQPVQLPAYHAGIFTSPVYLIRFTENRRRARQFFEAFLCSPFLPPPGGLDVTPESALEPNLQERDGCKYCHKGLDPAAAYWGRWTNRGAGYLDPLFFPDYNQICVDCVTSGGCPFDCGRHYITGGFTTEESAYIGWLQSFQFLKEQDMDNVAFGPKLLFQKKILDGSIANGTTKTAIQWLINRKLEPFETKWLTELSSGFMASGYSYKALIKAIVTHPYFRRVL